MAELCESCKFFEGTPAGNRGKCHRFPPSSGEGFPNTYPDSYCGEFKKQEIKK